MSGESSQSNLGQMDVPNPEIAPIFYKQPHFDITNFNNLMIYITMFSPIILILFVIAFAFILQNLKGVFYLIFLIVATVARSLIYSNLVNDETKKKKVSPLICDVIKYTEYGNSSYGIFVFTFTFWYLLIPMVIFKNMNFVLLILLILYLCIDISFKQTLKCIQTTDVIQNILFGSVSILIVMLMIQVPQLKTLLFFNKEASNNEQCSMTSSQTFKCSVYKNGTLLASTTA
jgi:hypothetical protein